MRFTTFKPLLRITIALLSVVILFSLFWMAGGKSWIAGLISTEDWAHFDVPENVLPLQAEFRVSAETVTVCNRGPERMTDLLVRVNSAYLAKLESLEAAECKEIPFEKFAQSSWKRIPAYRNLQVTEVELLASVAKSAYVRQQFPAQTSK